MLITLTTVGSRGDVQPAIALGIGPRPIPRSRLMVERLADSITQAVTDPGIHQRAAALGAKIRAEDGVGSTVKVIQMLL